MRKDDLYVKRALGGLMTSSPAHSIPNQPVSRAALSTCRTTGTFFGSIKVPLPGPSLVMETCVNDLALKKKNTTEPPLVEMPQDSDFKNIRLTDDPKLIIEVGLSMLYKD